MSYVPNPEEAFAGAVIGNYEVNGYHDSDFYAVVYDAEKDVVTSVLIGTTRAPSRTSKVPVDITPENLEKATAAAARQALHQIRIDEQRKAEALEPGKVVRLTRDFNGRKNPSAKEGELVNVATVFEDHFKGRAWGYNGAGTGKPYLKVKGWTVDGREVVLPDDAVEVADPDAYMPTEAEMVESARKWAERSAESLNFRGILEGWLIRS